MVLSFNSMLLFSSNEDSSHFVSHLMIVAFQLLLLLQLLVFIIVCIGFRFPSSFFSSIHEISRFLIDVPSFYPV